jgi:inner membrane protein
VDNLCHSLVGAALSAAGFRRRTGLATATMIIGANLPDVDAVVYLVGDNADGLAFRRGWTHGILAMVVLPFVLTAIMLGIDRWRSARRTRLSRADERSPVDATGLLLTSAVSIWSHPLFDWLNTYGVRLFMPFSSRWFYGDALFIIDPWVWSVLALGAAISLVRARRVPVGAATKAVMARAERPARIALGTVGVYIAIMVVSSRIGRLIVERQATASGAPPSTRVMVAPMPLTPVVRTVIRDVGTHYELGSLTWTPTPRYTRINESFATLRGDSILALGPDRVETQTRDKFLVWARFPFRDMSRVGDPTQVRLDDARYGAPLRPSFASVLLHVRESRP